MSEQDFKSLLKVELCKIPDVTVWTQNCGVIVMKDRYGRRRAFHAGPPAGAADISGIDHQEGRRIEIETKAPKEERSAEQIQWAKFIQASNGLYLLATQHDDLSVLDSAQWWARHFVLLLNRHKKRPVNRRPKVCTSR